MLKRVTFYLFILILLSSCNKKEMISYDTFVGRWEITALYLNGGTNNMLPMAQLFEPCFKGSTLEFTNHQTFELLTDCEWMADKGSYNLSGETIEAIGQQGTQYFTFTNGHLTMNLKHEEYTFVMQFDKQEFKSEYIIQVMLQDTAQNVLKSPVDYDTTYYVKHQADIDIAAAHLPNYRLLGDSLVHLKEVMYDHNILFTYEPTKEP